MSSDPARQPDSPTVPPGRPPSDRDVTPTVDVAPDWAEATALGPHPAPTAAMPADGSTPSARGTRGPEGFVPGGRIGEFHLLEVLGEGSFGSVFLARQESLERRVALKITANAGDEARTMASLEHRHIVQVFSEAVLPERDLRLLCMQYVPGTTLERVIDALSRLDRAEWNGRAILEIVDALSRHQPRLDPGALRDRELLARCDFPEAVCWIGARLAEALACAHQQQVLHRDIKPANVLVNPYGQPMLADFSVSFRGAGAGAHANFGGTLAYMAPEHLAAVDPDDSTPPEAVDERSDVYALGLVLYELLTGERPFPAHAERGGLLTRARAIASVRHQGPVCVGDGSRGLPEPLERVLRCCLDPDPRQRYQTAAELVEALEGCRELLRAVRALPPAGRTVRAMLRLPFLALAIVGVTPHVLGSIVNISYNHAQLGSRLTVAQQETFERLILGYNAVAYPACLWLLFVLCAPVYRFWRRFGCSRPDGEGAGAMRRRALTFPLWGVVISCVGWLPGGLVFPVVLHAVSGPLEPQVFGHFFASFAISGLIAATYSFFGIQFVVLRVLYPRLWGDVGSLAGEAGHELAPVAGRLRLFQLLAGMIPLAGAVLMVGVGPEQLAEADYRTFRVLVTVLIGMGMAGFGLAIAVTHRLQETLAAFIGK